MNISAESCFEYHLTVLTACIIRNLTKVMANVSTELNQIGKKHKPMPGY